MKKYIKLLKTQQPYKKMVDKDDIYSKSVAAIDKLTLQIYKEFQEEHKDLLIQNPKEYWRRASIYKEDKLRKILYNMKK